MFRCAYHHAVHAVMHYNTHAILQANVHATVHALGCIPPEMSLGSIDILDITVHTQVCMPPSILRPDVHAIEYATM